MFGLGPATKVYLAEDLLKEMDVRATSLRMSRAEYLKALVRIDLHARPELLPLPMVRPL